MNLIFNLGKGFVENGVVEKVYIICFSSYALLPSHVCMNRYTFGVSEKGYVTLLSNCRQLKNLSLQSSNTITDHGLSKVYTMSEL
jgi:hypothetical protein